MRATVWSASATALAAMLLAMPADAKGVNLSWSRCRGDGGTQNRAFACDTNVGAEVLVCSFVLDEPLAQVSGNEVVIDLLSGDDPLPAWWEFKNAGTCRQSSLGMNTIANASDVTCVDWGGGQSVGGIGSYSEELGAIDPGLAARHRRLKIAVAVPLEGIVDLAADTEYFACNVVVNHAKSVGAGMCDGCTGPVCMNFFRLRVTTPSAENDVVLETAAAPGSAIVTWQGTGPDCNLVPVKRTTWSQVKGLYR